MKKIIHIFDMDDTLLISPTLANALGGGKEGVIDIEKHHPGFFKKMKSLFWDRFLKNVEFVISGDFIVIIDSDSKKPIDGSLLKTYFPERKWDYYFTVEQNKIIIKGLPGFYSEPTSLGKQTNKEIANKYNSVDNKMIVTGRDIGMKKMVEDNLKEVGLKYPNYGLYLYPRNPSIKEYKCNVILNSIEKNNWGEVHFYEDHSDWLYYAEGVVNEKFPNVKFVPHHITNVHNQKEF